MGAKLGYVHLITKNNTSTMQNILNLNKELKLCYSEQRIYNAAIELFAERRFIAENEDNLHVVHYAYAYDSVRIMKLILTNAKKSNNPINLVHKMIVDAVITSSIQITRLLLNECKNYRGVGSPHFYVSTPPNNNYSTSVVLTLFLIKFIISEEVSMHNRISKMNLIKFNKDLSQTINCNTVFEDLYYKLNNNHKTIIAYASFSYNVASYSNDLIRDFVQKIMSDSYYSKLLLIHKLFVTDILYNIVQQYFKIILKYIL